MTKMEDFYCGINFNCVNCAGNYFKMIDTLKAISIIQTKLDNTDCIINNVFSKVYYLKKLAFRFKCFNSNERHAFNCITNELCEVKYKVDKAHCIINRLENLFFKNIKHTKKEEKRLLYCLRKLVKEIERGIEEASCALSYLENVLCKSCKHCKYSNLWNCTQIEKLIEDIEKHLFRITCDFEEVEDHIKYFISLL